jgi:hypothetical protein
MLSKLFLTKNQKLVKKWKKEHELMVEQAHKVIAEYVKNNHSAAKANLRAMGGVAADHLTNEDIEFYKLTKDPERNDAATVQQVTEFQDSFKDVKHVLMKFLAKYGKDEAVLDEAFFDTFNSIVDILTERIEFEESKLYFRMSLG